LLQEPANHDQQFQFSYRGPVVMKGKAEPMKVYYLNRGIDAGSTSSSFKTAAASTTTLN
jgi:class 3 adenylate cyclase